MCVRKMDGECGLKGKETTTGRCGVLATHRIQNLFWGAAGEEGVVLMGENEANKARREGDFLRVNENRGGQGGRGVGTKNMTVV